MPRAARSKPHGPRPVAEPRRRPQQERGEKRVEELLDAAADVFAGVGIEAATTNAIAQRAGASVSSLYHFFPNKDALIRALAARYADEIKSLHEVSLRPEAARLPVSAMVEGIVTPLAAFMERNPAYLPIYQATSDPRQPSCASAEMRTALVGMVEALMKARSPRVSPAARRLQAGFAVELVHGMLEYAWSSPAAARPGIVRELKRVLALHAEMIQSGRDPLRR